MAKNDFIFVDESGDTGYKLDPDTGKLLSSPYFVLAALHVTYELILDRVDMTPNQVRNLETYLRNSRGLIAPRLITQADSIYVEGLQIVDNIASGFKDVIGGATISESLSFVNAIDITLDRNVRQKGVGQSSSRALWEPD